MADIDIFSTQGAIKMRVKFPVYDDYETVVGSKYVTENLGYVKGGNSDTAKIIINAFTNLYDVHEIDAKNTTVTYEYNLLSYIAEQAEDEPFDIVAPENTLWNLSVLSLDQLGTKYNKSYGYIKGSLTPEKAQVFDELSRAIVNLSNNTLSNENLGAIFKPYEGDETNG